MKLFTLWWLKRNWGEQLCSKERGHFGKKTWDSGNMQVLSLQKRRLGGHGCGPQPSDTQLFPWGHWASWVRPWCTVCYGVRMTCVSHQLHTSELCASGKLLPESQFLYLPNGNSNTNPKCLICIPKIQIYLKTEHIFISPWQTHLAAKPDLSWHEACYSLSLSYSVWICMCFVAKY